MIDVYVHIAAIIVQNFLLRIDMLQFNWIELSFP
jgi:hypothetical protein